MITLNEARLLLSRLETEAQADALCLELRLMEAWCHRTLYALPSNNPRAIAIQFGLYKLISTRAALKANAPLHTRANLAAEILGR